MSSAAAGAADALHPALAEPLTPAAARAGTAGAPSRLASRAVASPRFARAAFALLIATLLGVLSGAVVRITGSGDGCGQHWPSCHGELVPRTVEATIEFSHRMLTGSVGLVTFALAIWAFRAFPRGDRVRRAMLTASVFVAIEAFIGAVLVRRGFVGQNASLGRALMVPLHLVSTSALTGGLALAAWWTWPRRIAPAPNASARLADRWVRRCIAAGMLGVLIVSALGALTALGDTLYPIASGPMVERLANDQRETAHFLERLRLVHPLVAVAVSVFLFYVLPRAADRNRSHTASGWIRASLALIAVQLALGGLNVLWSAPGWLQIGHLLLACLIWILLVILADELEVVAAFRTPS